MPIQEMLGDSDNITSTEVLNSKENNEENNKASEALNKEIKTFVESTNPEVEFHRYFQKFYKRGSKLLKKTRKKLLPSSLRAKKI